MVRLWGKDDRPGGLAAALDAAAPSSAVASGSLSGTATLTPTIPARRPGAAVIEIGVDLPVSPSDALEWFCVPEKWTRFQGQQAWLDPKPGGRLRLDLGGGVFIRGQYLEVGARQLSFSWGKEGDNALPAESTHVTVDTAAAPGGCFLVLRHDGLDGEQADSHRSGWRYHLLRLAVACSGSTGYTELVDLFLAAAAEPDPVARRGLIDRVCGEGAHFAIDEGDDDHGTPQIAGRLGRLVEQGHQRVRSGPVERRGGVVRAPFEVTTSGGARVADGELVAAVKDKKLVAVGLFESPRSPQGTRASSTALRPQTAGELGGTQPRPTHPAPDAADLPPAPRASSLPPPRPADRWNG
jgi:Activator of Hsp90 ATPase homolog 1-like protein